MSQEALNEGRKPADMKLLSSSEIKLPLVLVVVLPLITAASLSVPIFWGKGDPLAPLLAPPPDLFPAREGRGRESATAWRSRIWTPTKTSGEGARGGVANHPVHGRRRGKAAGPEAIIHDHGQ